MSQPDPAGSRPEPQTVAILYPGDMGAAIGQLLLAGGRRVITFLGERSHNTKSRAEAIGITALPSLSRVAAEAGVVLSIVPPRAVVSVAESYARAARHGGAPFVDLNAKALTDLTRLAAIFGPTSVAFANGCIIGQSSSMAQSGRIFVSGPHCPSLIAAFDGVLGVFDLGADPGTATAFKMAFAGLNKAVTAAIFETAMAAHGLGVFEALMNEIAHQLPGFLVDSLISSYPRHIARRADEMAALVALLKSKGLRSDVAAAAMTTFQAIAGQGALSALPSGVDAMSVLRALSGETLGQRSPLIAIPLGGDRRTTPGLQWSHLSENEGAGVNATSDVPANTTVRDVSLSLLRAFGMTTIFGNPGSTELPLFRDFPDDFRYVLALQESLCVGMADGYAQSTRNAAVVNLHSAVGVGHALGNIFTAYKNQTPLVITAGQQARSILPFEPFLFASQATELPKPYVKWSCEPARAEDVPAAIARAYYTAMQPPRGPTFVSIPVDDWDRPCAPIEPRRVSSTIRGDSILLEIIARELGVAERPVFVVGASVARDDAWNEVIALAERHEAPVWVAPMSARNSFPEDHRLFAGFLAADRAKIVAALSGHDLILVLGAPAFTYHIEGLGPHIPAGAKLFQLTDDPSAASWAPVGAAVFTSLTPGLRDLLAGPQPPARLADSVALVRPPPLPGSPLTDKYLLQQIAMMRPRDSIIVEEAPSSRGPIHDYLPILERDTFYTCASGGLGHGLPAAIGIALARPGEKVIAILGDGSSMYAIQGLWTASQLELPITFVIINNSRYEALCQFGHHFGLRRTIGTTLRGIDFCGIARSQGCRALHVDSAERLDDALREALAAREPTLIEVVVQ